MKEKIIAFDFDGTLALSDKIKIEYTKKKFDKIIASNQTTAGKYPLGKKKYADMMKALAHKRIMDFELDKDVMYLFKKLKNLNYKIIIITSRHENDDRPELTAVKNFCKNHALSIDEYYHTSEKSKNELMMDLNPLIMIDDSFSKLEELSPSKTKLIYIKRPWNDVIKSKRIHTINRMKDVLKYI